MSKVRAAGVFLVRNDGKLLIVHPTGHKPNVWSIPKGKVDKGEMDYDAALRELHEETNVDLYMKIGQFTIVDYVELPVQVYSHKRKELWPFVICESRSTNIDFNRFDIKCNSTVPLDRDWNAGKPEVDDFKWVTIDEAREVLHETQVACLDEVDKIHKNDRNTTT
jgi:8-oxo-dGTP pyrophosphatase MutT (NUDIX family)